MRSLSARLAAVLAAAGADTMFGLPGGGPNLDVIGAAERAGIRFVLAHGETAATLMASTHGLLTGQPSPVVVTRGPGLASAVNGAAQATLDRAPVVIVSDTVPAVERHRVAHQRLDQRALMAPVTKHSATVSDLTSDADLAAAVGLATTWPYGAVHLDHDATAPAGEPPPPAAATPVPAGDQLRRARTLLDDARRPVVIVGAEAMSLCPDLERDLERLGCPVLTTYQAVGALPTEHELAAGLFTNGALEAPVLDAADLVVTVGLDLVEPIPAPWTRTTPVVRLSPVPQTDAYLDADADLVGDLAELVATALHGSFQWPSGAAAELRGAARAAVRAAGGAPFGPVQVVDALAAVSPAEATVTVDAGAHFLAVMPLWPVTGRRRLLISNGLATMGFAVPAAIGAALARPGEPVLALTGDGGMAMTLAELETIGRLGLPITVVVFDDAALSLIEIKQRSDHGGPGAVRYRPVDFAAVARAAGIHGVTATSTDELAAAVAGDQHGQGRPRLVDARIDPSGYPALLEATRG